MLETFNFRVILEYLPLFLSCFMATLWLSGAGLLGALIVGTVACGMRISRFKLLVWAAGAYIESIRSTPLLVQLFFFYFGLPSLGIRMSEAATGILALTLNSGAYMAEIIRAGIQSIPHGHVEAAVSSGLNYLQRMRHIILPQAIGVTLPSLLGQAIVLVKDSALLSLISLPELTRAGQIMTSERFMPAEGFLTSALFYLLIYYSLKCLTHWSQRRLIYIQP
jgi:His/Glu/Gln/Arg/opine family amino acid ABC transporter permease subunit